MEWVLFHKKCGHLWFEPCKYLPEKVKCSNCGAEGLRVLIRRKWNGKRKNLRELTVAHVRSFMGQRLIERFGKETLVLTSFAELARNLRKEGFYVQEEPGKPFAKVTIRRR